jgi:hypothetical protein
VQEQEEEENEKEEEEEQQPQEEGKERKEDCDLAKRNDQKSNQFIFQQPALCIMGSSGSTPKNSQKMRRHPRRPSPQLCRAVLRPLSASAWAQAIAVEKQMVSKSAAVEQPSSGSEPSSCSDCDDLALANLRYHRAYDADSIPRCIFVTLCLDTHHLPPSLTASTFDQHVALLRAC